MRQRATTLRPSFRDLPFWRRAMESTRELATPLLKVGMQWVWSPVEDVTLRLGGPRTGKTGELACRILDAPGAEIAQLRARKVLLIRRGLAPCVGTVQMAWKRPEVRHLAAWQRATERLQRFHDARQQAIEWLLDTAAEVFPRLEPLADDYRAAHQALRDMRETYQAERAARSWWDR